MKQVIPPNNYYVPAKSHWPIIGSIGLALTVVGIANLLHHNTRGHYLFLAGALCITYMLFGWFGDVIKESHSNLYSKQMDRSFRWGMGWFIFSEVMFFAAFFGALFYARIYSVPWLGGAGTHSSTHSVLWPEFKSAWPLMNNPNAKLFANPGEAMGPWGLPAFNTVILLLSGATLTWAHHAGLLKKARTKLVIGLALTVILGICFLGLQVYEYILAYQHNFTLASGIYGSTFFMLTGFHGAHVTLGAIMLTVILIRCIKGHFTPEHHFAFEAVAWYWHFVDAVWLFLFLFVYML